MRPHKRSAIKLASMLIMAIFALASQISSSRALGWSVGVRFTMNSEAWDEYPSIMQTRDGTIWVFWSSDSILGQYDIFYKTSSNNGASWSSEKRLTADQTSDDYHPSAMQSQYLTIWVVWTRNGAGNGEIFYKKSSNNGSTWTGDVQLTSNAFDDSLPSIFQDLHGTIWIVWHRALSATQYNVFYVTSSDNGLSWSSEKQLAYEAPFNLDPSIMGTGNGTIWIVYSSFVNANYELFYKNSTDYGTSWSNAIQLTTSTTADDLAPSVIQDMSGTIWVFWARDSKIYYKTSTNNGAGWSPDNLLLSSSGFDENPSVTTTINRKIWLVWQSTRTDAQWDIYYKISDEISPVHDIALTKMILWLPGGHLVESVSESTILFINVTVENQGQFTETFNVTVYADRNTGDLHVEIETQYGVTLPVGNKIDLKFTWNTLSVPYGTYYLSSNASIVPGEYDIADNLLFRGAKLAGITAPPGYYKVSPFVMIAPLALVTSVVAAFGAAAVALFRFLMSIKPWRPWRRRKSPSQQAL